jgi:hypothetical protein
VFERLYASPLYSPGLFWLAHAATLLALAWKRPRGFTLAFVGLFTLELALDAYVQGGLSPLKGSAVAGVPFVILGDFRYFWLIERARGGAPGARSWAVWRALAWAFVVPVASYALMRTVPWVGAAPRHTFLVYEASMVLVVAAHGHGAVRGGRRALYALFGLELSQYALWALADVLILLRGDVGFLLRLVPNTFYYAGFLPAAWALVLASEPPQLSREMRAVRGRTSSASPGSET